MRLYIVSIAKEGIYFGISSVPVSKVSKAIKSFRSTKTLKEVGELMDDYRAVNKNTRKVSESSLSRVASFKNHSFGLADVGCFCGLDLVFIFINMTSSSVAVDVQDGHLAGIPAYDSTIVEFEGGKVVS